MEGAKISELDNMLNLELEESIIDLNIRSLSEADMEQTSLLDYQSDFSVSDWIEGFDENTDHAWGVFIRGILVGYCTLGYADDCGSQITDYPNWNNDCMIISNVYVLPEYRNLSIATKFISYVLENCEYTKNNLVFLTLLEPSLLNFYKRFGFVLIDEDYCMVKHCDSTTA